MNGPHREWALPLLHHIHPAHATRSMLVMMITGFVLFLGLVDIALSLTSSAISPYG
jgi:hypothetical protein